MVANLSAAGLPCLLASGEESRDQVALRAHRLGIPGDRVAFASGRELGPLVDAARAERPFLLAVDSIQSLRDSAGVRRPADPRKFGVVRTRSSGWPRPKASPSFWPVM